MGMYNNSNKYLSPDKLAEDYEPLIKTVYKRFNTYFENYNDKLDLYNQVYLEFMILVNEYDPRRGVDFPCYIKRMLNQRVYHYITKQLKTTNSETPMEDMSDFSVPDITSQDDFERIECLENLDTSIVLGKKQRELMEGILLRKKSLEELAEEEGVNVKTIRLRLHFLSKKLIDHNKELEVYDDYMSEYYTNK